MNRTFFNISSLVSCFKQPLLQPVSRSKGLYLSVILFGGLLINLFTHSDSQSQIIPVNDIKEEQVRLQQLFHGTVYTSFTDRPIWNHIYDSYMDLADPGYGFWSRNHNMTQYDVDGPMNIRFGVYRPSVQLTNNSTVPYGENNEIAWYGRGINTEFIGGFWLTSDYMTVTVRPHIVSQQNSDFEIPRFVPTDDDGNYLFRAEGISDIIDRPIRFGATPFTSFSQGYTSIRLHYKPVEIGFSTEPRWWGGNIKYPLLMSNNAPGMQHFFLGTRYPIQIPYVGSLEFTYLAAFPEDSDFFEWEEDETELDRFMGGINISFSPAFAPNLHLGFARAVHTYIDETGFDASDLGLIFDPFLLEKFIEKRGPLNMIKSRNHLNTIYARWVWPESRFELYGEFYREDFAWDSRDLLTQPRHNSGYAFGFQKLVEAPYAHFYRINLEFTNMTPSHLREVRLQNYYYTHSEIRQGHTHRGQLLGAAIGPGSNSQYLSIDSYQDWGRFGLYARRLADNNHFHFEYDRALNRPEQFRQGYGDYWRHRTDLTIGTRGLYSYGDFVFSGELSWTKLFNYGRFDYGQFGGLNISNFEPYDITNVQFQVGVSYVF